MDFDRVKRHSEHLWKLLYLFSLPAAIFIFFIPQGFWGAIDEGQVLYEEKAGVMSWLEHFSAVFLPPLNKVFLFGTYRPAALGAYFKLLSSFGLGIDGFRYVNWIGSWICCLAFSWGIYTLIKKRFSVKNEMVWISAFLIWWTPTWVLCSHMIFPDCWIQPAFVGLFWGLFYSDEKDLFWVFKHSWIRYSLGTLVCFLAYQSHETTFLLMCWMCLWLISSRPRQVREWVKILFPLLLGVLYILVYRSLEPTLSNRPEIKVSFAPTSILVSFTYYLLITLNGISKPVFEVLGLNEGVVGQGGSEYVFIFLISIFSVGSVLVMNRVARGPRVSKAILLMSGGMIATLPYLLMVGRALVYYGIKLQMFLSVLVVLGSLRARDSFKTRFFWIGLFLYWLSSVSASFVLMDKNWAKYYGGISKGIYEQILSIPGVEKCTPEMPCCIEFPQRGWLYNEYTVNWNDGARIRPRFVKAGEPCTMRIRLAPKDGQLKSSE